MNGYITHAHRVYCAYCARGAQGGIGRTKQIAVSNAEANATRQGFKWLATAKGWVCWDCYERYRRHDGV